MLYNALWLRLFGLDNLLPNQTALFAQAGGSRLRLMMGGEVGTS